MIVTDQWGTPPWVLDFVTSVWGPLDLDVAAARWNAKAPRFFSQQRSALRSTWKARHAWMNPPYSDGNLPAFTERARHQVLDRHSRQLSGLVPADPSTDWFRENILRPHRRLISSRYLIDRWPDPFDHALQLRSSNLEVTVIFLGRRVNHVPGPSFRAKSHAARFPSALFHLEARP